MQIQWFGHMRYLKKEGNLPASSVCFRKGERERVRTQKEKKRQRTLLAFFPKKKRGPEVPGHPHEKLGSWLSTTRNKGQSRGEANEKNREKRGSNSFSREKGTFASRKKRP